MRVLLLPEQLMAMIQEELDEMEMEGEFLVFDSAVAMDRKLSLAMRKATTNSRPVIVDSRPKEVNLDD